MSQKTAPQTVEQLRADILAPVIEENERIDAGERAAREAIEGARAEREEAMAVWRAEAMECRQLFQPEPPMPAPLDMPQHTAVLHRAVTARKATTEWQDRLLAEHRGRVETAYRAAFPDLLERTQTAALGATEAIAAEWNGWLRLVKDCRAADERSGGRRQLDPPSGRMRTTITPADLLDAVNGVDLLDPFPPAADWIQGGPRDGFHQKKTNWPDGPDGLTRNEARELGRPGGPRWFL